MVKKQQLYRNANVLGLVVILIFIAIAYQQTLRWMYERFIGADSYYSHGFLVPFVSLFFIYQQLELFGQTEQTTSKTGFIVLLFALLLHILGTILYVFSISGFSMFFLVIGLTLFLFGFERAKVIWFPLFFLVFMFPLPMAVINLISFPLKMFAAKAGVFIVAMLGVPVYGEGFNIFIPAGHLLVGNPCSGLRSLISFLALGSVFAYMAPLSTTRKWILFLLTVPVALLSNIVRVPILIMVSHYYGLDSAAPDTFVHTGSGMLVFVFGFLLLFWAARMLEWNK